MGWLCRYKLVRKPVTLVGAACTSMLVGVFILNKMLSSTSTNCACSTKYASYERLQKHESSRKVRHQSVKSFDVNFLGSNSPIEDRFVIGKSDSLGVALFSVIDGHKGSRCSHFLQKHLLQYIASSLTSTLKMSQQDDLAVLMDMNSTVLQEHESKEGVSRPSPSIPSDAIGKCLVKSFVTLDDHISNIGLEAAQEIVEGHSLSDEKREQVLTAIEGACAISALITKDDVFVANTGDCRVVLGQKLPNGSWTAVPLSADQNAQNPTEVERVFNAHPGEKDTVIVENRLLGSLMPFRTFGDVDFKWNKNILTALTPQVWPNYISPPYVTARPVITHRKLEHGDSFLILASDGLWERISNEEAVNVVQSIKSNLLEGECCGKDHNAATELLWHALGGSEDTVRQLLNVDPSYRRMFRDDITTIVVHLH